MTRLTPPQIKLLDRMRVSGQRINLDAQGNAFLADGTRVNQLTLRALVSREYLTPCGMDLFGKAVTAYEINEKAEAA